jgi:hypothetical protein
MKVSVDELDQQGYRFIEKMDHDQLVPFITPYLSKTNEATLTFVSASLVFLCGIIFLAAKTIAVEKSAFCILYLIAGCILAYGLIPIHEYIHALAYKNRGAKAVSYGINFKKFIFLTVADKFVASQAEFLVVAMAPFSVISAALMLAFLFVATYWQIFILGMLFVHALFCIGDFGLASFFLSHKGENIVTYDDKTAKATYFYTK